MRRAAVRLSGVALVLATLAGTTMLAASGGGAPTAPDAAAAKVLAAAQDHVGDAYTYGATGPDHWDCSGLTSTLWRAVGGVAAIPRTAAQQQAWAWPLRPAEARPGDLVFFGDPVTHVGVYEGNGRIVDASSSKAKVVERAVWTSDVVRYGRVPRPGVPHPTAPAPASKPKPAAPSPKPTTPPAPPAAAAPAGALRPVPHAGQPLRTPTTPQMARLVRLLRTRLGLGWAAGGTGPRYDATGLLRWAWGMSQSRLLPVSLPRIEAMARPVALRDLAVGDLVLYGSPAVHVGVYVGNGEMIDASKVLQAVVRRPVFASRTVRFARLAAPKSR